MPGYSEQVNKIVFSIDGYAKEIELQAEGKFEKGTIVL